MGLDKLDHAGLKRILTTEFSGDVNALAHRIAANVRAQGLTVSDGEEMPVTVDEYTTDRGAASVTITHPAGLNVQAKHGALTRAAAEAGVEVR